MEVLAAHTVAAGYAVLAKGAVRAVLAVLGKPQVVAIAAVYAFVAEFAFKRVIDIHAALALFYAVAVITVAVQISMEN